jgi:hypothetical protein
MAAMQVVAVGAKAVAVSLVRMEAQVNPQAVVGVVEAMGLMVALALMAE